MGKPLLGRLSLGNRRPNTQERLDAIAHGMEWDANAARGRRARKPYHDSNEEMEDRKRGKTGWGKR